MNDVEKQDGLKAGIKANILDDASSTTAGAGEVLSLQHVDPALDAKMHLVNNVRASFCPSCDGLVLLTRALKAIDEIGWTVSPANECQ